MSSSIASYATDPYSARIERSLPAAVRDGPEAPEEEWLELCGYRLHLDRWSCPDARATLLLLHGGGGTGRLLAPFARLGVRAGAEVLAPDLPGYGLSALPDPGALRYDDWRRTAAALMDQAAARGRPVVVFGLSMGGMLALDAAADSQAAAAVLATCLLDGQQPEVRRGISRFPWIGTVSPKLLGLAPRLTDQLRVPMAWVAKMATIANDPQVAAAIRDDPRSGGNRVPLGFLRSYLATAPRLGPGDTLPAPLVLAHPGADRWTPPALSLPYFEQLKGEKELVMLDGAGHLPVEHPGFTQLAAVMARTIDRVAADAPAEAPCPLGAPS